MLLAPWVLLAACSRNELGAVSFDPVEPAVDSIEPGSYGAWTSFDTSPDGSSLTMSYYDRSRGAVGYAVGTIPDGTDTFTWLHEQVDGYNGDNGLDSGDRGKYSAQRTLPDGTVWVVYQDVSTATLRGRLRRGPGVWDEAVDIAPGGAWATMELDGDGHPLVVHCTDTGTVAASRFDGTSWTTDDLYTSAGGAVEHTHLLIADGKEYVAFRDAAVGHLHLLTNGRDELVDASGDTGAWPTLAIDGSARWIAYQDLENQDLRLAKSEAGGRWTFEVVDAGELRGADTFLEVEAGTPEILYFDGFDNDLRLATLDGSAWVTERLAGETVATGFHNRLVRYGGAQYWFTYDYTNSTLLSGRR